MRRSRRRARRGLCPGRWRDRSRAAVRGRSATRPRSASTRPRTSRRSATAARSRPRATRSPSACAGCASTAGAASTRSRSQGGRNSRLDELQAAVLRRRLAALDAGNAARRSIVRRYAEALPPGTGRVRCAGRRRRLRRRTSPCSPRSSATRRTALDRAGIATDVHYPDPRPPPARVARRRTPDVRLPAHEHAGERRADAAVLPRADRRRDRPRLRGARGSLRPAAGQCRPCQPTRRHLLRRRSRSTRTSRRSGAARLAPRPSWPPSSTRRSRSSSSSTARPTARSSCCGDCLPRRGASGSQLDRRSRATTARSAAIRAGLRRGAAATTWRPWPPTCRSPPSSCATSSPRSRAASTTWPVGACARRAAIPLPRCCCRASFWSLYRRWFTGRSRAAGWTSSAARAQVADRAPQA